jgi:hypothetical protein
MITEQLNTGGATAQQINKYRDSFCEQRTSFREIKMEALRVDSNNSTETL